MNGGRRRVAALDLGSNTFLSLVAERAASGELVVIDDRSVTVRLGSGLAKTGRIAPGAVERGLKVLAELLASAAELGVERANLRAVGTAALRRAANAGEFVARAQRELGLTLDVVSEAEEARLGLAGAGAGADLWTVDVGGGSTEVAGGGERRSVPLGALVLTERHLVDTSSAWSDASWATLTAELRAGMAALPRAPSDNAAVLSLGGTGLNLASLVAGSGRYDPRAGEGREIERVQAAEWAERLRRLPAAQRRQWGIDPERAEILPAGLACLAAALERVGTARARVTGRGLRHGVALGLLDDA